MHQVHCSRSIPKIQQLEGSQTFWTRHSAAGVEGWVDHDPASVYIHGDFGAAIFEAATVCKRRCWGPMTSTSQTSPNQHQHVTNLWHFIITRSKRFTKHNFFLHFSKGQMVSTHIFFLRFPTHSVLKAQFVKIFSEGNDFNTHLLSTLSKGHDLNAHVLSRFYIFHSNWFQSTSSILDCSRKLMFKVQSMFSTCSKGLYFQNTCVSIFSKELDFNAYLISIFCKGIDFESSSSILYIFQKKWFQHTSSFYIFPKEIIFNVHLLSTISKAFNVQST